MKKFFKIFILVLILIFFINVAYFSLRPNRIAVIGISGIINSYSANIICDQLKQAEKDPSYEGILLKINSPGGDAAASEKIYYLVKSIDQKKPVVALIEEVGASGAYFAALGARKIVAYPASLTGSIGVIFEGINAYKLANKIGVESFVVKSGDVKDAGNPLRKPTQADKQMLFSVVESVYNQFLHAVSSSRHIDLETLKPLANGRVFSGQMALKEHLIDSIGGFESAKHYLKVYTNQKNLKFEDINDNKTTLIGLLGLDHIKNLFSSAEVPGLKMIFK